MEYEVISSSQSDFQPQQHSIMGVDTITMVFGRYMLLIILILTDLNLIRNFGQEVIDDNNLQQNLKKDSHIGDELLLVTYYTASLQERYSGPFPIQ